MNLQIRTIKTYRDYILDKTTDMNEVKNIILNLEHFDFSRISFNGFMVQIPYNETVNSETAFCVMPDASKNLLIETIINECGERVDSLYLLELSQPETKILGERIFTELGVAV